MIWTRWTLAVATAVFAVSAKAEQYTTAAEVRPILEMTTGNWVAVRKYNGKDLVYFSHLVAWRCGLDRVRYGINGPVDTELTLEKCNTEYQQPNVILDTSIPIYISLPLDSVKTISVEVTYDDGEQQAETIDASKVLIP